MSMSVFIDRPVIRDAFKEYSAPVTFPFEARTRDVRAPSFGGSRWVVGAAWNYMLLFRAGRELAAVGPAEAGILDTGWLAETAVKVMEADDRFRPHYARWSFLISKAREVYRDYLNGAEIGTERLAKCCQFLAAAESVILKNDFVPITEADPKVTEELLALDRAFDPVSLFPFQRRCVMGPSPFYSPGWSVGRPGRLT